MAYLRTKYLEQRIGDNWIIFGEHRDGTVDVADAAGDIFEAIPRPLAQELIALRDKFLADVLAINERINSAEPPADKPARCECDASLSRCPIHG